MRVLGIETSCDETAAAIVERDDQGHGRILSNVVLSQIEDHAPYGGVVPEIAARAHVEVLDRLIGQALHEAQITLDDVDAVAATAGPGLIGGLIVGLMTGKAIAMASQKPFYAINHLEGHALTPRLTDASIFLICCCWYPAATRRWFWSKVWATMSGWARPSTMRSVRHSTRPPNCSACPIPEGLKWRKRLCSAIPDRFTLPRPLKGEERLDFSFSGLKTAVRQLATTLEPLSQIDVNDICAAFQTAVADTLDDRVSRSSAAVSRKVSRTSKKPALVVAGGVAANKVLRDGLQRLCSDNGFRFIAPPMALCTDNAAMIAWAGAERAGGHACRFALILRRARAGHWTCIQRL